MSRKINLTNIPSLLKTSALWGALAFVLSFPNLYYYSIHVFYGQLERKVGIANMGPFFFRQGLTLFFLFVFCSFCGFSFSKRYELPGLGSLKDLRKNALRVYVPLSLGLWIGSYFLFDRFFMKEAPVYFPKEFIWALTVPFRAAFLEETIFRFGMLTVMVGGMKRWFHPQWANLVVSLFYSITITHKTFQNVNLEVEGSGLGLMALLGSFLTAFFLGYLFIRKGLLTSLFVHFLLACKFLIYAIFV